MHSLRNAVFDAFVITNFIYQKMLLEYNLLDTHFNLTLHFDDTLFSHSNWHTLIKPGNPGINSEAELLSRNKKFKKSWFTNSYYSEFWHNIHISRPLKVLSGYANWQRIKYSKFMIVGSFDKQNFKNCKIAPSCNSYW